MVAAGNDSISAAAFAFLVHLVLWLPPTVAGGLYMLFRGKV
jgi:ABC-type molybdate transport system permease subunit